MGIAGKDFAVIAADTRLSSGYSILSRNVSKATVLNDSCVVATGGCRTDVITLHKNLTTRMAQYDIAHQDDMSCTAVAQMLSNTLYYRRFFPFYAFNIVAGVDADGKGGVFTYDAIGYVWFCTVVVFFVFFFVCLFYAWTPDQNSLHGSEPAAPVFGFVPVTYFVFALLLWTLNPEHDRSFERTMYAAQGSGQKLIIPVLDNLIGYKNREQEAPELTVEETVCSWCQLYQS